MLTIYGQPLTKKESAMLALTVWVDKAKGNRVSFYHWGSGRCNLSYKALGVWSQHVLVGFDDKGIGL
jgi:hypothetical protein